MAISRFDPLREALSLRHAMDQLFEQSFVSPRWIGSPVEEALAAAPMDVIESDQGYQVRVALPGIKPEDIELTINQNMLTIKGHYRSTSTVEPGKDQQEMKASEQGKRWLIKEIHTGTVQRSITLDRPIDVDHIQTSFENGILSVNLPLSASSQPRKITVGSTQESQKVHPDGQAQASSIDVKQ